MTAPTSSCRQRSGVYRTPADVDGLARARGGARGSRGSRSISRACAARRTLLARARRRPRGFPAAFGTTGTRSPTASRTSRGVPPRGYVLHLRNGAAAQRALGAEWATLLEILRAGGARTGKRAASLSSCSSTTRKLPAWRREMRAKPHKLPISVLVVVHTPDGQVLLLERADRPGFWQSVTGSQNAGETLRETAVRELREETGIDAARYELVDWGKQNVYEIYPHWRHRYAPGVTHNTEHVFGAARCRSPSRSRSRRASISPTRGCRGATRRTRRFRGATPKRYASCRSGLRRAQRLPGELSAGQSHCRMSLSACAKWIFCRFMVTFNVPGASATDTGRNRRMEVSTITFDRFKPLADDACEDRIVAAKRTLGERAVILGHHYQRADVYKHADLTGDSLRTLEARLADRRRIHRVLRRAFHGRSRGHPVQAAPEGDPARTSRAGCSMADMANLAKVERAWRELGEVLDPGRESDARHLHQFGGRSEGVLRRARRHRLHVDATRARSCSGRSRGARKCCSSPTSTSAAGPAT